MSGHHHHYHGERATRVLRVSLVVTLAYIVLLVITGLSSHSLALLSEAGHNASDFLALLLSLVAVYLQARAPSATKTYGYHRAGVLAAFINAGSLVLLSFYIFYEAAERFRNPAPVHAPVMIGAAAVGVVVNAVIALMLYRAGSQADVNLRSVFLHELGDTLSTVAVIAGGWAIMVTGQTWIDSALSFGIAALILWSSFGILRETLNILLEGLPAGMQLNAIEDAMQDVNGVLDVHDLHVWSIGSNTHALSCHVLIADIPPSESEAIMRDLQAALVSRFHIHHSTIQFEHVVCDAVNGCVLPTHVHPDEPGHQH